MEIVYFIFSYCFSDNFFKKCLKRTSELTAYGTNNLCDTQICNQMLWRNPMSVSTYLELKE